MPPISSCPWAAHGHRVGQWSWAEGLAKRNHLAWLHGNCLNKRVTRRTPHCELFKERTRGLNGLIAVQLQGAATAVASNASTH